MLRINDLNISFLKKVIENGNIVCYPGEIVMISGKSGSGKTSILRFIMGELPKQSGKVFYHEEEITHDKYDEFLFSHLFYIDQMGHYYQNMTIKQHFEYYAHLHHITIDDKKMKEYLDMVLLSSVSLEDSPVKLSTGERKRFLIALAFMLKKRIILMDEPTASLDNENIDILIQIIQKLKQENITFIISSHNSSFLKIADALYEIKDYHLIEHRILHQYTSDKSINKKPQKINYFQYKNKKQKHLFIIIILMTALSITFMSWNIVNQYMSNKTQNEQLQEYKNDILYLNKATDNRNSYHDYNTTSILNYGEFDYIDKEEIENIKTIEGAKQIEPVIYIEKRIQKEKIKIYKDNQLLKSIDCISDLHYDQDFYRDILITGYYDGDIKKDQQQQKIYINDVMADILQLDDYQQIQVAFEGVFIFH